MVIEKCIDCNVDPLSLCSNLQESKQNTECYQIMFFGNNENTFGPQQQKTCRRSQCSEDNRSCFSPDSKGSSLRSHDNDLFQIIIIMVVLVILMVLTMASGFLLQKMRSSWHVMVRNKMTRAEKCRPDSNSQSSGSRVSQSTTEQDEMEISVSSNSDVSTSKTSES